MSAPVPEGFALIALDFDLVAGGRTATITIGCTDADAATVNANATAVRTAWIGSFVPAALSSLWQLTRVRYTATRGGLPVDGVDGNVSQGTATFNPVSPAVAALLRKVTDSGGRKNRGRMYLPAGYLGELAVSPNGTIDSAVVSDSTGRFQSFIAALTDDDLGPVILHADSSTPTDVVDGFMESQVCTQRRRQRK